MLSEPRAKQADPVHATLPHPRISALTLALLLSLPANLFSQNVDLEGSHSQGQPLTEATNALIEKARVRVIDSMKRAPRYTCTETIERRTWDSRRETHSCDTRAVADKLASQDRLRLDVAIAQDGEIFSWHGEKQFNEGEIGDLVSYGMIGSGLFSSFLSGIFGDHSYLRHFSFVGTPTQDGQELAEYQFAIPTAASHWLMRFGNAHAITGYHGSVWIDRKTAALQRIHISADDLPPELQTCAVEVDLRYHVIKLGSNEFIIPETAETISSGPSGVRAVSETTFLQCHEFLGESTLHFDSLDEQAAATPAPVTPQTRDLPAGIHFSVDLETPIDTSQSWVGDQIIGRLSAPIKLSDEVLAPKGARVLGRLVALRTNMRPDERLEVGFDWQQIEAAPATLLLLRAEYTNASRDVTFASHARASLKDQPMSEEGKPFVFVMAGSHKTLSRHMTTTWVTVSLKKESTRADPADTPR